MVSVAGKYLGSHAWGGLKNFHYHCLRINRDIVRRELLAEVKLQGIPIYLNKKCAGISEEGEEIVLRFADGETVRTDYLVGADGIHSMTRQYLYPGSSSKYSGLLVALGHTQRDRLGGAMDGQQLPCMYVGKNGTFSILPNSYDGGEIGYFITTDVPDRGPENWALLEKDKGAIVDIITEVIEEKSWPKFVRDLVEATSLEMFRTWP